MEGSVTLTVGTWSVVLKTKDFILVPANTVAQITPIGTARVIVNTAPSYAPLNPTPAPTPAPTCVASVALVARPDSWVSGGLNYRVYDVQVQNVGVQKIKSLKVQINKGSAQVDQKWNLDQIGNSNVYALPDWYQAFPVGGQSTSAGLILKDSAALAPSVSVSSISC